MKKGANIRKARWKEGRKETEGRRKGGGDYKEDETRERKEGLRGQMDAS